MNRLLLVASLAWLTGLPPAGAQESTSAPPAAVGQSNVVVTLTNGTKVEGRLQGADDRQIQLEEQFAGGTIVQTETIARTNIVAITPLTPAELAVRAEAAAYQNLRRYRLNPQSSYPLEYYDRVIDNVLRPFLNNYPQSPQITEVTGFLRHWQDERRLVAAGQAKFQGRWMSAKDAGPLLAREQAGLRLQQARLDLQHGQYERAIASLRLVETAEAHALITHAYDQWSRALGAERDQLQQALAKAQQELSAAIATKNQLEAKTQHRPTSGPNTGTATWVGPSQADVATLNKVLNDITNGSNEVRQVSARLQLVQNQLAKVSSAAQKEPAFKPVPATTGRVVDEPVRDAQAPIVQRENWDEPDVLRQIAGFARQYWLEALIAVGVGVVLLTWKLAK